LAHSVREGFMGDWQMSLIRTGTDVPELLTALRAEVPLHPREDRLSENL
ncbi:TIGR00730 family Rossman fold protein, partial [Mycobacterium tuberculosis]